MTSTSSTTSDEDPKEPKSVFLLVRNIPSSYHSSDLRRHFTDFVETNRFECFHFRHRPEVKVDRTKDGEESSKETRCCVIKVNLEHVEAFLKRYHAVHWTEPVYCNLPHTPQSHFRFQNSIRPFSLLSVGI